MKGYKTSKDYKRLKELLDSGYRIILICDEKYLGFGTKEDDYYHFGGEIGISHFIPKYFEESCEQDLIEFVDPEDKQNLTWQQLCKIVETAAGLLGKNINEELMGRYDSPKEFYELLQEKLFDD